MRCTDTHDVHAYHLRGAALLALRGHGGAEPNPMVGCVIVNDVPPALRAGQVPPCPQPSLRTMTPGSESRGNGITVGWGYHRQVGGPHAEIVALQRAGAKARGATLYCTLEPCNHHGRTGPCTQAIIDAGIARVIVARRDPWPVAAGGLERLRAAGVETLVMDDAPSSQISFAHAVSDPFVHRMTTGLPWVTVKWAQTSDGFIALPSECGRRWISNEASRHMVHRERGRVDAILTGVGTVLADDPLLTPRGVRVRRAHVRPTQGLPLRVVVDPRVRTPPHSQLAMTAREVPTLLACDESLAQSQAAARLQALGLKVIGLPCIGGDLPLDALLKELAAQYEVAHLLVEAGLGLMTRLFRQQLVNEAWTFTAPITVAGAPPLPNVRGMLEGVTMQLWSRRRRGGDVIERYRVR